MIALTELLVTSRSSQSQLLTTWLQRKEQYLYDSPHQFRVELMGQLNKIRSAIQPESLEALMTQLRQIATGTVTNVQNSAARRDSRGESSTL